MDADALLSHWHAGVREMHIAHSKAAAHYDRMNVVFGVPVVIFTTGVGTAVFASINSSPDPVLQVVVGFFSVAAAVLASLQTFLRYAERAEKHHTAIARWGALRRKIEHLQVVRPVESEKLDELLASLQSQWDALENESPTVPQRFQDRAIEKIRQERAKASE